MTDAQIILAGVWSCAAASWVVREDESYRGALMMTAIALVVSFFVSVAK